MDNNQVDGASSELVVTPNDINSGDPAFDKMIADMLVRDAKKAGERAARVGLAAYLESNRPRQAPSSEFLVNIMKNTFSYNRLQMRKEREAEEKSRRPQARQSGTTGSNRLLAAAMRPSGLRGEKEKPRADRIASGSQHTTKNPERIGANERKRGRCSSDDDDIGPAPKEPMQRKGRGMFFGGTGRSRMDGHFDDISEGTNDSMDKDEEAEQLYRAVRRAEEKASLERREMFDKQKRKEEKKEKKRRKKEKKERKAMKKAQKKSRKRDKKKRKSSYSGSSLSSASSSDPA